MEWNKEKWNKVEMEQEQISIQFKEWNKREQRDTHSKEQRDTHSKNKYPFKEQRDTHSKNKYPFSSSIDTVP